MSQKKEKIKQIREVLKGKSSIKWTSTRYRYVEWVLKKWNEKEDSKIHIQEVIPSESQRRQLKKMFFFVMKKEDKIKEIKNGVSNPIVNINWSGSKLDWVRFVIRMWNDAHDDKIWLSDICPDERLQKYLAHSFWEKGQKNRL